MTTKLNSELIRFAGLDLKKLELHQKRIDEFVHLRKQEKYKIVKTCTIANMGIIGTQAADRFLSQAGAKDKNQELMCLQTATVLLAAGAATRFFEAFTKYCSDVEELLHLNHKATSDALGVSDTESTHLKKIYKEIRNEQFAEILHKSRIISGYLQRLVSKEKHQEIQTQARLTVEQFNIGHSNNEPNQLQQSDLFPDQSAIHEILVSYFSIETFLNEFSVVPKAVVPITPNGDTLLIQNIQQQIALCRHGKIFIVIGQGTHEYFKSEINRVKVTLAGSGSVNIADLDCSLINQGCENSTIRFSEAAEPLLEDNGHYSVVAGGHGEIINHFNSIADASPSIRCLHIRTIDNIFGQSASTLAEINRLFRFFFEFKHCLDLMRNCLTAIISKQLTHQDLQPLTDPDGRRAFARILSLMETSIAVPPVSGETCVQGDLTIDRVYAAFEKIFCWPPFDRNASAPELLMSLNKLIMRPLTVFGVVNLANQDVGGVPVYTHDACGNFMRICLESAHISERDQESLKTTQSRENFFNSAVIFVETTMSQSDIDGKTKSTRVNFNEIVASDVYLIAKKQHKGHTALYHELAMFELLSHSGLVNSIFMEVPRTIFRPNKSILDTVIAPLNLES